VALNKEKVTANAMKYLQRGQVDKAVREFEKILEVYPADERALQKVGDLYARMGMNREALNAYRRVSDLYVRQGFYSKAIAVFNQILALDPDQIELRTKLGEMYHQLGLLSDAIQQYQLVYRHFEEKGRSKDALAILRNITLIDPDNLPNRIRLAEGYIKEGMRAEGLQEYEKALEELARAGREDEYLRVLDRLVHHAPENGKRGRELVKHLLERGEEKKGLARLKLLLKEEPDNLETLDLLARAFFALRQLGKTVTVYKEMARILKVRGDVARLNTIYQNILKIDPEDGEARRAISEAPFVEGKFGSSGGFAPPASESSLEEIGTMSEIEAGVSAKRRTTTPARPAKSAPPVQTLSDQDVVRILTEAEVYAKYGLHEQAEERLDALLAVRPEQADALARRKEISLILDKPAKAHQALVLLAVLHLEAGRSLEARAALDEAKNLAVEPAAAQSFLEALDALDAPEAAARIREAIGAPTAEAAPAMAADNDAIAELSMGEIEVEPEPAADDAGILPPLTEAPRPAGVTLDLAAGAAAEPEAEVESVLEKPSAIDLDVEAEAEVEASDIDFDQDIEIVDSETGSEAEQPPEAEIIEELELPSHMRGASKPAAKPSPSVKPAAAPPVLPEPEAFVIDEEFDEAAVDEMLIAEEIAAPSAPAKKPQAKASVSEETAEAEIEAVLAEMTGAAGEAPNPDEGLFDRPADLRADRAEPQRDADIPVAPIETPLTSDASEEEASEAPVADMTNLEFESIPEEALSEDYAPPAEQSPGDDGIPIGDEEFDAAEAQADDVETPLESVAPPVAAEPALPADAAPAAEPFDEDIPIGEEESGAPEARAREAEAPIEDIVESTGVEPIEAGGVEPTLETIAAEMAQADQEPEAAGDAEAELSLDEIELVEEESEAALPAAADFAEALAFEAEGESSLETALSEADFDEFLEAEFFFTQQVFAECVETYKALAERYADQPLLRERYEICRLELEEEERLHGLAQAASVRRKTSEPPGAEAAAAPSEDLGRTIFDPSPAGGQPRGAQRDERHEERTPADGTFNLTDELRSEFDQEETPVVRRESAVGVTSLRVPSAGRPQPDVHFNLGMAYREMNRQEEAIGEFLVALDGPQATQAALMLGLAYLKKDMPFKAVEFFSRAFQSFDLTKAAVKGIRYDVARLYLARQRDNLAFLHLSALVELDPDYRDAPQLVRDLAANGVRPAEPDTVFAAFEDIEYLALPDGESDDPADRNTDNISYV